MVNWRESGCCCNATVKRGRLRSVRDAEANELSVDDA